MRATGLFFLALINRNAKNPPTIITPASIIIPFFDFPGGSVVAKTCSCDRESCDIGAGFGLIFLSSESFRE